MGLENLESQSQLQQTGANTESSSVVENGLEYGEIAFELASSAFSGDSAIEDTSEVAVGSTGELAKETTLEGTGDIVTEEASGVIAEGAGEILTEASTGILDVVAGIFDIF